MTADLLSSICDPEGRDPEGTYDGVRGELPDWIPKRFHCEFHATRTHLHSYSHKVVLGFVAEVIDTWDEKLVDNLSTVPSEILQDIVTLAFFSCAVRRGNEEGEEAALALLTDSNHARLTIQGKKFSAGRKPGTIGPVRKFIRAALKRNPASTNEELWSAIKQRPPRGWTAMENTRFDRYIEGPTSGENVGWDRFCNIAAEERKGVAFTD